MGPYRTVLVHRTVLVQHTVQSTGTLSLSALFTWKLNLKVTSTGLIKKIGFFNLSLLSVCTCTTQYSFDVTITQQLQIQCFLIWSRE